MQLFVTPLQVVGIDIHQNRAGKHVDEVSEVQITAVLKLYIAGDVLFALGLGAAKLSVLALYARGFGFRRNTSMRWKASFALVAFITADWVAGGLTFAIWQCHPVQKSWLSNVPGHCLRPAMMFSSSYCRFQYSTG